MNADDFMQELAAMTGKTDYESIDELNAAVRQLNERRNNMPRPQFDGLSPAQMHRLLHFPFDHAADMVSFASDGVDRELLVGAPLVQKLLTVLQAIYDAGKIQGTQNTGALPRKLVVDLHEELGGDRRYAVRKETDSQPVHISRLLLEMAGWIKVRKHVISATAKGKKIVESGFAQDDYLHLLKIYARKFNWSYSTYFGDVDIVQLGFLFGLRLLMKQAKEFIPVERLTDLFLEAFPPEEEVDRGGGVFSPRKKLTLAFQSFFVLGFAHEFGLAEMQAEARTGKMPPSFSIRSTRLATQLVAWHV